MCFFSVLAPMTKGPLNFRRLFFSCFFNFGKFFFECKVYSKVNLLTEKLNARKQCYVKAQMFQKQDINEFTVTRGMSRGRRGVNKSFPKV